MRHPLATAIAAALMALTAHAFAEGMKPEGGDTGSMQTDAMTAGGRHADSMTSGDARMKSDAGGAMMEKQPDARDAMGRQ